MDWMETMLAGIGRRLISIFEQTGNLMLLFWETCKRIKDVSWPETFRQMARLGVDSLPIVLLTLLATGMVFSIQTAREFVKYGAQASAGGIVAIAMGRELCPALTGVVVAGRVGAAIAAEIGTMKVTEQVDALRVMATNPVTYLVAPRFLACVLMMPILVVFANAIGNLGGYFVATYYAGISNYTYLHSIEVFAETLDITGGLLKSMVFGGIIATVGCYKGLTTEQGAEGVGLSTTASVVLSIILIFLSNYFLSLVIY